MILSAILPLLPFVQSPVLLSLDGKIFIADQNGAEERFVANSDLACWSPDQSKIVLERENSIFILDLKGRETAIWKAAEGAEITGLTWGPSSAQATVSSVADALAGSSILFSVQSRSGASIYQIVPEQGSRATRLDWLTSFTGLRFAEVDHPSWSPSGDHLAFTVNGDLWMANRIAPEDGSLGGWVSGRVAAAASYDGGTCYGSHWTTVVSKIVWAPNEGSLAYTLTRIGGSGVDEVYRLRLNFGEDRQVTEQGRLVSDQSHDMYFDQSGNLHYRIESAWKVDNNG